MIYFYFFSLILSINLIFDLGLTIYIIPQTKRCIDIYTWQCIDMYAWQYMMYTTSFSILKVFYLAHEKVDSQNNFCFVCRKVIFDTFIETLLTCRLSQSGKSNKQNLPTFHCKQNTLLSVPYSMIGNAREKTRRTIISNFNFIYKIWCWKIVWNLAIVKDFLLGTVLLYIDLATGKTPTGRRLVLTVH